MCYNINKVPDTKLRLRERMRKTRKTERRFGVIWVMYVASCWDAAFCIVKLKERYSLKFKDSGNRDGNESSGYEHNR